MIEDVIHALNALVAERDDLKFYLGKRDAELQDACANLRAACHERDEALARAQKHADALKEAASEMTWLRRQCREATAERDRLGAENGRLRADRCEHICRFTTRIDTAKGARP
jgi:chromosome segregation ATPase